MPKPRKPSKSPDQLRAEAKAHADGEVKRANALRAKAKQARLSPRDEVSLYQAALNQYVRNHGKTAP